MPHETLIIEGREIILERPDKVLFPDDGITKKDLALYYERIAPFMLPHMRDRPLTLHRFPDGIDNEGFYQKDVSNYFPPYIRRSPQKKEGGTTDYAVADNAASLVYLAGQAAITLHAWLSREDKPEYPDMLVFDLDPSGNDFEPVRRAAFRVRELVETLEVTAFVKTTGSKGLHIAVPLDASAPFNEVRPFAHEIASFLAARDPEHLTIEERKVKRGDRVFLDTLRNSYAATAVAPYSVRALPGAPIATPLEWKELDDNKLNARTYRIANIFKRMEKKGDPWRDFGKKTYSLEGMQKRFGGLKSKEPGNTGG
jgi:bifunctional non-homologous end joining protein LigD